MPGINLSQPTPTAEQKEERRLRASDKIVYLLLFCLIVVGSGYGLLMYFSADLDKKQIAITDNIQKVKKSYASEPMLRAAKFSIKGDAIVTKRTLPDLNPMDELQVMSKNVLPDVVLDSYENDFSTNTVSVSGHASAFFRVAQQMKILQDSGNFSSVTLKAPLTRGDDGLIAFSLNLVKVIEQKQN